MSITIPENYIKDITLLSVEEAKKLPKSILTINDLWWLRTPGRFSGDAAVVLPSGSIYDQGCNVSGDGAAVRPALRISNLGSSNIKLGNTINCLGMNWYYVEDDLVIAYNTVGDHCFNNNYWETVSKRDAGQDIFEGSDIQKYLQDWLKDKKIKYNTYFVKIIAGNKTIDEFYNNDIQKISRYVDEWLLNEDPSTSNIYAEVLSNSNGKIITIRPSDLIEQ